MKWIRLKSDLSEAQLKDRMSYRPEILEFHLVSRDLEDPRHLMDAIADVQSAGTRVYLHHPMQYEGSKLDIMSDRPEMVAYYKESSRVLAEVCKKAGVRCVIHAHYGKSISSTLSMTPGTIREIRKRIADIDSMGDGAFLWEDTTEGWFCYSNRALIPEVIEPLNLSLVVDVSHTFIGHRGDNDKLRRTLEATKKYADYYHVVDSKGKIHDSLPLGEGTIEWGRIRHMLADRDFIFEINLSNVLKCKEMIDSAAYFERLMLENGESAAENGRLGFKQ